jgi:hypothetical protein
MGAQTRFYEVFLALANVRLGTWLPNPWFVALKSQRLGDWTVPGLPSRRRLSLLAREIFGIHPSWARMLLCTDGGHYDNLGLIELLRLRCGLIYCFDASGGGPGLADSLAGTLAVAREELGVDITLADSTDLVPGGMNPPPFDSNGPLASLNARVSKKAVITGAIKYPEKDAPLGTLIFAQATLTTDLPYQVLEYSQDDLGFPRDSTADQWFNSQQFDAYQQLGRYLGQQAVKTATPPVVTSINPDKGSVTGRTSVTVTGSGFTNATKMTFGTVAALEVTASSDTQLTAITPPSTAGTVDVRVTTPAGTSATAPEGQFTYDAATTEAVTTSALRAIMPDQAGDGNN